MSCPPKEFISTGIPSLDYIMGRPGIPVGRIVEIAGFEATGKSALAIQIMKQFQKAGAVVVLFDTECSYDLEWAQRLGLDTKEMLRPELDHLQGGFNLVEDILKETEKDNTKCLIVWDSLSATPAAEELEGDFADVQVGLHARIMARAFRRLTKQIPRKNATLLFVEQLKEKITSMPTFGKKPTSKIGGHAVPFHATLMLEITKAQKIKEGEDIVGIECKVSTQKNKLAPPFRETQLEFYFDKGFCVDRSYLDIAVKAGIVKYKGGWYLLDDYKFRKKEWFNYMNNGIREKIDRFILDSFEMRTVVDVELPRSGENKGDIAQICVGPTFESVPQYKPSKLQGEPL